MCFVWLEFMMPHKFASTTLGSTPSRGGTHSSTSPSFLSENSAAGARLGRAAATARRRRSPPWRDALQHVGLVVGGRDPGDVEQRCHHATKSISIRCVGALLHIDP